MMNNKTEQQGLTALADAFDKAVEVFGKKRLAAALIDKQIVVNQ